MIWEDTGDLSDLTVKDVTSKPEIAQVLLTSRDDIVSEMGKIDNLISQRNEEIRLLQNRKKPWEEVLAHIEALLKIDNHRNGKQAITEVASCVSITDAAFALLQRLHSPTHYKEIAKKLQEDNVHIPGKNPSATLLSRISRDKRFKRAKKRGEYALSVWRIRKKSLKSGKRRKSGRQARSLRGR